VVTLALPGRGITALPPGLSAFGVLRRLDFSRNALTSCRPLASLRCAETLSHIDLSHNALTDLSAIRTLQLPNLAVLNVSNNKLTSLATLWEEAADTEGTEDDARRGTHRGDDSRRRRRDNLLGGSTLANLKALIASNNAIASITGLEQYCTSLETLVISHNPVGGAEPAAPMRGAVELSDDDTQGIPDWSASDTGAFENDDAASAGALVSKDEAFWRCVSSLGATLKKLSASKCGLGSIHGRSKLPRVTELRLSHNAIATVPATVRFKSLQILDVATNNIETPEPLRRFPFLRQLNLMGNPLAPPFDDDAFLTTQWAPASFEGLALVDGRKVAPLASEDARRTARRDVLKAVRAAEEAGEAAAAETGVKPAAPRRRARLAPDEIPLGQEVDVVLDASKVAGVSAVEARKVVVSVKSRSTAQQAGRRGGLGGVAGADAAKALETAAASAFQPW
jgi:hypothetical protein